jgi:cryptochrome
MSCQNAIHWFRKGLRLHDNPALVEACTAALNVYPLFILDPHFAQPDVVGVNRYAFLLQSLQDLDISLRSAGSRLFVVQGTPEEEIPKLLKQWSIDLLTFEEDSEPYAKVRDAKVSEIAVTASVRVSCHASHTLHNMDAYSAACAGHTPTTYGQFIKLFNSIPEPLPPIDSPVHVS